MRRTQTVEVQWMTGTVLYTRHVVLHCEHTPVDIDIVFEHGRRR